jgi:hypothetical protein
MMSEDKCVVKFFNSDYEPEYCEILRLKNLQYELGFFHAEVRNQCKNDRYSHVVRVESMASQLRNSWKVIDGHKKDRDNTKEVEKLDSASLN